jgi:CHAT domain-containing protein
LAINPDLVVLSACETGKGKIYSGEGSMSVARGFKYAGANQILFTLWNSNDYTTSKLMEKFYESLSKTNDNFESNHQSKLNYLLDNSISDHKKSPYYWGAFVYYGSNETNNAINWIYYLFFGIVAILILIFYKKIFINYFNSK